MSVGRVRTIAVRACAVLLALAWAVLAWPGIAADANGLAGLLVGVSAVVALGVYAWPRLARALARAPERGSPRAFVTVTSLVSALVAAALVWGPLHGMVFARDSALYLIEARALAHFHFGLPFPAPRLAYAAHFLFEGRDGAMHGVFAPGYPLFLVPFVWLGVPMLAAPVTAALLTVAQYALARTLADERTARIAVLVSLASFARAIEDADLLSHAFVATTCAFALALAYALVHRPLLRTAALLGVCVGWTFAARLLDGFLLAAGVAVIVLAGAFRGVRPVRAWALAIACFAPFAVLVALQQHAATGSYTRATSVEYASRADYPATCLHLGLGRDVGCRVEHPGTVQSFGPDGYTADDWFNVVRERTSAVGGELFGLAALVVVALLALAWRPRARLVYAGGFCVAFSVLYGAFYYGNAPVFGARHLFPLIAPLAAVVAASFGLATDARVRGAVYAGVATLVIGTQGIRWPIGIAAVNAVQGSLVDVNRVIASQHLARALLVTSDLRAYLAGFDPWRDGRNRVFVLTDRANIEDLRRFHRDLTTYTITPDGSALPWTFAPPAPGIHVEFERAWPSLVRPDGLGVAVFHSPSCCNLWSSGEHVLFLFASHPGASLRIPFDVADTARYRLRAEGFVASDYGDYALDVDGIALPNYLGFQPERRRVAGPWSQPVTLRAGPHVLTARCIGKQRPSRDYNLALDVLVGEALSD